MHTVFGLGTGIGIAIRFGFGIGSCLCPTPVAVIIILMNTLYHVPSNPTDAHSHTRTATPTPIQADCISQIENKALCIYLHRNINAIIICHMDTMHKMYAIFSMSVSSVVALGENNIK